jgi:hypothetical protein
MTATTLTASDLQCLKSDPRFTAAHAALLDIMIQTGEVVIEPPADSLQPSPVALQGVKA